MKKYDIYIALLWAGLAIFVIANSLTLKLGVPGSPGPGFFPLIVGFIFLFFSGMIFFAAIREKKHDTMFSEMPNFRWNVFYNIGILLLYSIFLLERLGFVISGFLILLYFYKVSSEIKWGLSILLSVIIVLSSYYFFGILLEGQFPEGFIEQVLKLR